MPKGLVGILFHAYCLLNAITVYVEECVTARLLTKTKKDQSCTVIEKL